MLSRMSLRLSHRTLTKNCNVSEILASRRSLHNHTCQIFRYNNGLKNTNLFGLSKQKPILAATFIRYASTGDDKIPEGLLHSIPDPPTPPAPQVIDIVQGAGESTLSALGLGGYTPIGMIQTALEWLHIAGDIPWWGTIVIGTLCVRILMFPLVIRSLRNSAKMHNCLPQIQDLQMKMTEARQEGNNFESAKYAQELSFFMKEKGIHPMRVMLVPLAQAPLFVSFFLALRGMANAPVASMREGGLWWFADLTVPDQYYLLPLITSTTMYLTLALGVDGVQTNNAHSWLMPYVIKCIPIIIFPFIMRFDGAILCYWVSTNFISLVQSGIMKIPAVRETFKIEAQLKHEPSSLPIKDKGFVSGFKQSISNMKKAKELSDRGFMDNLEFERAGRGPLPKTYKYDPTKQAPSPTTVFDKKRD